ncbi:hypothetical protein [Vibrio aquaticus]|nr:hypothetical protein [Vibrio aquaticus]
MKRFFPSNVMLIPFVVRNYAEEEPEELSSAEESIQENDEERSDE